MRYSEAPESAERYRAIFDKQNRQAVEKSDVVHTEKDCPSFRRIGNHETIESGERLPNIKTVYISGAGSKKVGPKWCDWCRDNR